MWSEATGEIEKEGGVLVIRRIHVKYRLKIDAANREKAERVMKAHVGYCPVARSLAGSIDITTELEMQDL
ncbi:MAG: OsmC family protein [Gemmatimonadetes bacterium]|nr:OsmC family protein [Gemmatimonadota bacterium]